MITKCLEAAGITRVVWIDDHFAAESRNKNVEKIISALRVCHKTMPAEKISFTGMPAILLSSPLDDLIDECEKALSDLNEDQVSLVAKESAKLVNMATTDVSADISNDEYKELLNEFGGSVNPMSFAKWSKEGEEKYKNAGKDTLFLVDKEFHNEDTTYTGLEVLESVTKWSEACCILFTHRSTEPEQERLTYAANKNIPAHRFAVVGKLGHEIPIANRFERALRAVFIHRQTGDLAYRLAGELKKSAEQTCDELISQSVIDIGHALFDNSIKEGASELDVLLRIFFLKQRRDARNAFKGELRELLLGLRKFRADIASQSQDDLKPSLEKFREWRKWEIYEEGELINPIHSPLSCGDLFECFCITKEGNKGASKQFVLLAQPCDLMIREKGSRNAEVGLFALVREKTTDELESKNTYRNFEISGVLDGNKVWLIDFLNAFIVDLSILDYCVFNGSGKVEMSADLEVPDHILLKGYEKILDRSKKDVSMWLAPNPTSTPRPISIGKRAKAYAPQLLNSKIVQYPVRRVGRLEPNIAHAILGAWANYQARAALDHDFARNIAAAEKMPNSASSLPS